MSADPTQARVTVTFGPDGDLRDVEVTGGHLQTTTAAITASAMETGVLKLGISMSAVVINRADA